MLAKKFIKTIQFVKPLSIFQSNFNMKVVTSAKRKLKKTNAYNVVLVSPKKNTNI